MATITRRRMRASSVGACVTRVTARHVAASGTSTGVLVGCGARAHRSSGW